jgi:hypothetical protein
MEFTYDAYVRFVDRLRATGYEVRGFDGPGQSTHPDDQVLLLRHDVDLDLDRAVALAELEHRHGISSTYFFLLTSPFYNPASAAGRERVRSIAALGHAIGLHFDATVHDSPDDATEFNHKCADEARQLEAISGVSVDAVSFHRPASTLVGGGPELTAPRIHTYLPRYVREMEYCSDSAGVWRYGPPEERLAIARGQAMHLLTHAAWWGKEAMPPGLRMRLLLEDRTLRTRAEVSAELAVPVDTD